MLLLVAVCGASVPLKDDGEEDTPQQYHNTMVYLEHALEPGVFTHRGSITLGGIRGESAKITQNSLSTNELSQLNVCAHHHQITRQLAQRSTRNARHAGHAAP